MRIGLISAACVVTLALVIACGGGPSDEEVEAKAYEVIGRATPLMLSAGLNFEPSVSGSSRLSRLAKQSMMTPAGR